MMEIKVLSYNIHKGRAFFSRRRTWTILHDLLHVIEPDIVFLQEFLEEPQSEALLEKLADHIWPHHSLGQNALMGNYHYGNAILSKYPFISSENIDISNHKRERRSLLHGIVQPKQDCNLHLFCTHLDLTQWGRNLQAQKISQIISTRVNSDEPLLLAGDFNDWNDRLNKKIKKESHLEEALSYLAGESVPTSPSIFPLFPLDRIYFRNFDILSGGVLKERHLQLQSDHLPITVTLKI